MTIALQASTLFAVLALAALAGPRVLRQAAPALTRLPRLAVGLLVGSIVAWVLALLALGPMLAWIVTGPAILPGASGAVCQRCLAAANPSGSALLDTGVPVVVALLVLPAIAATWLAVSIIVQLQRRRLGTRRTARRLRAGSTPRRLHGYSVLVADDPNPFALTLPRRRGGTVISTGALDLLTTGEAAAVLAHEDAHLRQHHHLITAVVASLTSQLRWVPVLAAAADALGHYLEIAADDVARRRAGTPALASALLTLGQHARRSDDSSLHGALHALGPDRVRHLVQPGSGLSGVISVAATTSCLATLGILGFAVHVPYAVAVLSGCV